VWRQKKSKVQPAEQKTKLKNTPQEKQIALIESKLQKKALGKKIWYWLTATKERIFSLIFLVVFMIIMVLLGIFSRDPTILMLKIVYWFDEHTGALGLYLGVGIISIFGNFMVFIPSMYAIVLMFVAATGLVNVWLLGVAAGLGAAIGQIGSWFLGRATREMIDERSLKRLQKVQRWIERGLAPFLIFFFAATPLPDEVLLITIGLVNYSLWKTLIYCFFGKITLTVGVSILANLLSETSFGRWLLDVLFNLTPEMLANAELPAKSNIWTSIAVWLISALLIVIGGFVDWVDLLDRRKSKIDKRFLKEILQIAKNTPQEEITAPYLSIAYYKGEQRLFFPEDAFWFFEEKLHKKRDIYLRKSLIDLSAVVSSELEVTLSKEWLERLRENFKRRLLDYKEQEITLIKYPFRRLDSGVVLSNLTIISFKTALKNILRKNAEERIMTSNLPRSLVRRLLKRKITFDLLFEAREGAPSKIVAIGLTEGLYLRSLKGIKPLESLLYWLNITETIINTPKAVTNMLIYKVNFKATLDERLLLPKEFDERIPI